MFLLFFFFSFKLNHRILFICLIIFLFSLFMIFTFYFFSIFFGFLFFSKTFKFINLTIIIFLNYSLALFLRQSLLRIQLLWTHYLTISIFICWLKWIFSWLFSFKYLLRCKWIIFIRYLFIQIKGIFCIAFII